MCAKEKVANFFHNLFMTYQWLSILELEDYLILANIISIFFKTTSDYIYYHFSQDFKAF